MVAVDSFAQKATFSAANVLRHVRLRGIARVLYQTARATYPPGVRVFPSVTGVSIAVDPHDYFSCMMLFGRFAPELLAVLRDVVQPGDSVIDIGAQLGYVSANMARLVGPCGHVHSFEPDPNALPRLHETLEANGFGWVKVFPVAAADRRGTLSFNLSPMLGWSTAVANTHLQGLTSIEVRCERIDDLDAAGEIVRPVRLIKIDVEGFEASVFGGMQELLRRDSPLLISEINPVMLRPLGQDSTDVLRPLAELGYVFFTVEPAAGAMSEQQYRLLPVRDVTQPLPFCDVLGLRGEPDPRLLRRAER